MKNRKQIEVVVSGIGAKLPGSNNVKDFEDKLFSKSVLVTSDLLRWNPAQKEIPYMSGRIPDSDKFDYTFFGMPTKLVNNCDPQMGQMLERSYEAVLDAGVNPVSLKGHNVCVVSASSMSEAEILRSHEAMYLDGNGMVGHSRTMMANRISYCFNLTGPSYTIDASWVTAIQGLQVAANLVAEGQCEAAIVTTSNLLYHNSIESEYAELKLLAPDGHCSPFDANGKGFVRSEATITLFLQRAEDAKRHYCTVLNSEVCYVGNTTTTSVQINPILNKFYKDFYNHCKVNPFEVSYLEAFGCCDKDYDADELNAVSNIFYNGESPVFVGSVSGNIGNAECTSGFVSMVKSIIALECGVIPPTVNYKTPNPKVPALISGQLKPVTESTTLAGNLVAVNCLSFSGNVGHVLIKRHDKIKRALLMDELPADGLPRLVVLQTRHEEGARDILEKLSKMPIDTEFLSLINDVFKTHVPNYLWRTCITLPVTDTMLGQAKVESYPLERRPVWFIFSGMGSQWIGMGRDLLQIPMFSASIEKCDRVLAPNGLCVKHLLITNRQDTFDNIINCFVGIAAIQIGLVDILRAVGVSPDGMIGHSVGELGCAYADGCLTAEEMILAAYSRGKASMESDNIKGLMAAVGLGFNEVKDKLPSTIDVACHNSANSCTLSGPTDDMLLYVEELKKSGVFAKAVSAGGIAYHSRYIKEIGHKLLTYLHQVIRDPKPRSARWVSSSVPEAQWNSPEAQLCSAHYHTNNLLNSVLFEEASNHIPSNAMLLEIAPHGLLQAILRRSISSDSISLSLTNKGAKSNFTHLLDVLGRLHNQGIDLDVNALYPPVQYPVSRGTPSLVDLATWDHREKHFKDIRNQAKMILKGPTEMVIQTNKKSIDFGLWKDHCMKDLVVLPLSQLLMYPWKMMCYTKLLDMDQNCVVFEDVTIVDSISIKTAEDSVLVTITPGSFTFEVSTISNADSEPTICLRGRTLNVDVPDFSIMKPSEVQMVEVTEFEFYSLLAYFGYNLGPQFQSVKKLNVGKRVCVAEVEWTDNLVTFLDSIFKIIVFIHSDKHQTLMQLSSFIRLTINPKALNSLALGSLVQVFYDQLSNRLVCEGLELCGITLSPASGDKPTAICWREVKIQAHENTKLSVKEFLSSSIQLTSQTRLAPWATKKSSPINIIILKDKMRTSNWLIAILNDVMDTVSNIFVKKQELDLEKATEYLGKGQFQACLVVGQHSKILSLMDNVSDANIYWLTYSPNMNSLLCRVSMRRIMSYQSEEGNLSLFRKPCIKVPLNEEKVFEVQDLSCLERLRKRMGEDESNDHVVVVSSYMTPRHLLPILASEPYAHRLCTIFILDQKAPKFSVNSPLYKNTVSLGLPLNILSNGTWGTLLSKILDVSPQKKNVDRLLQSSNEGLEVLCTGLNLNHFTLNQELDLDEMELNCVDYAGYMGKERVMGVAQCDSLISLNPDPILKWTVPSYWTVEEAATVPVIYTLAYYCVLVKGYLQAGEDVLVHGGLSPLGQAVVGIALHIGANVFTTVTEEKEVTTLLDIYPLLNRKNVLVLGSQDIQVFIRKATTGKGVEVVVNCLQGNYMTSSVKAMGLDCRFLHLGQTSIRDRCSIGMDVFLKRTTFFGISLENIITSSHEIKVNIQESLKNGIKDGVVKPLKMTTFSFKEEANALLHLKTRWTNEKTILLNIKESKLGPKYIDDFICAAHERVIILGTKSELWLDVAEWLILRGARELVVFAEDKEDLMSNHNYRFRRLLNKFKDTFSIWSSLQLHSQENTINIVQEILELGDIAYIFGIQQDEDCSAMRNLDLASRKLVPHLRQFVSLLGQGAAVSESRAESDLPVCSIQSNLPLPNPAHVLPYLVTLPADFSSNSRFFLVSDQLKNIEWQDCLDIQSFLPSTLDKLYQLGDRVRKLPVFSEQVTLSPRYLQMHHTLLPVFIVPGFEPDSLQPLLRQLLHPAFCCSLPMYVTSVSEYAEILLQSMLKIESQSTFNLIGTSWGGPVALTLAHLLEARGHQVRLFLLEGAPSFTQDRVRALCNKYSSDFGTSLLADTLDLPSEVLKGVSQCEVWEDKLRMALLEAKVAVPVRDCISRALTSLYSQLNALVHQETPNQLFQGDLTLITCKPLSKEETENLKQFCGENTKVVTIGDESYADFIGNTKTAAVINENIAFDWKLQ